MMMVMMMMINDDYVDRRNLSLMWKMVIPWVVVEVINRSSFSYSDFSSDNFSSSSLCKQGNV